MTSADDTLALCVPAYNAAAHLPRLFETVHAQCAPFDELFVYDDASTDGTSEVASALGATVVRGERNIGASAGKNVLARHATSNWLHFHDADDAFGTDFIARFQGFDERTEADVVLFDTEDRDDMTGERLGGRVWDDAELQADPVRYCVRHTLTNCGVYRRASFLGAGGFDVDAATHYHEDNAMHSRLALAGLRFRAVNYPGVVIYRRRDSMSSGHPIECARAQYEVMARIAHQSGRRYTAEIGRRLWQLAGILGGYQDWDYVRRCLQLAASLGYADPVDEHAAIRLMARVSPFAAVRAREALIRMIKPELRRDMPSVR